MNEITVRQKEIVGAALAIITDQGLEALTIKNIADRVGFSDAAIYRHFQNKARILAAIVDMFAANSALLLGEINASNACSLEKIKLFFLNRCRVFSADRVLATVMFAENLFKSDPVLAAKISEVLHTHHQLLLTIIRTGQKQKLLKCLPPEHIFTIVMGALRLLVLQWQINGCVFDLNQAGEKLWLSLQTLIGIKNRRAS